MAKQTTEHLKLVIGNTVDSDQVLPDIAGNFAKLDGWASEVDEQLAEVADNAPNLAAETLARVQGDQQLTVGLTAAQADIEDLQDALPTKADLVDGRLHPAQIPSLAISNTTPVADQAAMLALTAEPGDIAKRLDLPGAPPFILVASPATELSNWLRLIGDYALAADLAATTALIDPRGSDAWLIGRALSQAYLLTGNQTYDTTHGTLTASDIQWEDGTPGHFAVTELDNNGAVTESAASYDLVDTSKVVIVTTPRNPAGQVLGAMTASIHLTSDALGSSSFGVMPFGF